jgi:DNA-binding response OmpR family regulator
MRDGTILLVEDDSNDEKLTRLALEKSNIANPVNVVHDGQEALDYLFDPERKLPAVVLLDLKLPKVSGLEVLRTLRADPARKLVPVVILTSSKEESDLIQGYAFGANSFIRKPVDFNQFSESVRQLGLYWLVMNEAPPKFALEKV